MRKEGNNLDAYDTINAATTIPTHPTEETIKLSTKGPWTKLEILLLPQPLNVFMIKLEMGNTNDNRKIIKQHKNAINEPKVVCVGVEKLFFEDL